MQRHRWFLPCALVLTSACASKAPRVPPARANVEAKVEEEPVPAGQTNSVASEAAQREQVLALLTDESRPASQKDWERLGPGTLELLHQVYGDSASPMALRLEALSAMGQLPAPAAAETLERVARDVNADVQLRSAAVLALVNGSGQAAVDDLVPLLNAPEETIRETTAKALGKVGGRVAQSSLEEQLERETEPGVRDAIQQSLTKIQP